MAWVRRTDESRFDGVSGALGIVLMRKDSRLKTQRHGDSETWRLT